MQIDTKIRIESGDNFTSTHTHTFMIHKLKIGGKIFNGGKY